MNLDFFGSAQDRDLQQEILRIAGRYGALFHVRCHTLPSRSALAAYEKLLLAARRLPGPFATPAYTPGYAAGNDLQEARSPAVGVFDRMVLIHAPGRPVRRAEDSCILVDFRHGPLGPLLHQCLGEQLEELSECLRAHRRSGDGIRPDLLEATPEAIARAEALLQSRSLARAPWGPSPPRRG